MAVAVLSKRRLRQKLCIEEAFKVYSFSLNYYLMHIRFGFLSF